jgi:hypothetical protein
MKLLIIIHDVSYGGVVVDRPVHGQVFELRNLEFCDASANLRGLDPCLVSDPNLAKLIA